MTDLIVEKQILGIAKHRINEISQLEQLPAGMGAEIDLRSHGRRIILTHDWGTDGSDLEKYLVKWNEKKRGTLILNTKEDGLEDSVIAMLEQAGISQYFFLDLPFPTIIKVAHKRRNPRVAVRISEYETLESAMTLKGIVEWIWIDSFNEQPPDRKLIEEANLHFKTCLVSPELQGYPQERIAHYYSLREHLNLVCTKFPESWL